MIARTCTPATERSAALRPLALAPLPAKPLVSILITNYNYAAYVGEAIESALRQTYHHFEVVVCDDGSTDDSCAAIEGYARRDERVRLVRQANAGQAAALDAAYAASRGAIICLLDADDTMRPARLAKVVEAFRRMPTSGSALHQIQPVDRLGRSIAKPIPAAIEEGWLGPAMLDSGLLGTFLSTSGLSFRREVAREAFPLPADLLATYRRKDAPVDMYLSGVARLLAPVAAIPEVLADYRCHGANGGVARYPTRQSIARGVAHFEDIHGLLRQYLARRCGRAIADRARLDDYPIYREHLLALYILAGRPRVGVRGHTPELLVASVRSPRRRRVWRLLLRLPGRPSAFALQTWWGMAPWKRLVRPFWSRLGVNALPTFLQVAAALLEYSY